MSGFIPKASNIVKYMYKALSGYTLLGSVGFIRHLRVPTPPMPSCINCEHSASRSTEHSKSGSLGKNYNSMEKHSKHISMGVMHQKLGYIPNFRAGIGIPFIQRLHKTITKLWFMMLTVNCTPSGGFKIRVFPRGATPFCMFRVTHTCLYSLEYGKISGFCLKAWG